MQENADNIYTHLCSLEEKYPIRYNHMSYQIEVNEW